MTSLVIMGLAAFYVTYVVTESSFPPAELFRGWVLHRWRGMWPADLVTCPRCISLYAAAVVILISIVAGSVPNPVVVWLGVAALSALTSALSEWLNYRALLAMREFVEGGPDG